MALDRLRHLLRVRKAPGFDPDEAGLLDGLTADREREARADLIREPPRMISSFLRSTMK